MAVVRQPSFNLFISDSTHSTVIRLLGAAKGLRSYLASSALVGVHLADQLLLPMALAGGGVFETFAISDHVRTNMKLIEQFLPVQFAVIEKELGIKRVELLKRI